MVMFTPRCPARYASVHGSLWGTRRVRQACRSVYNSKLAKLRLFRARRVVRDRLAKNVKETVKPEVADHEMQ